MYFVFPALRISSRAGIDSSSGVSIHIRKSAAVEIYKRTRINSVEVIQIWGETEPANCAVDVLFDVRRRVGHAAILEYSKSALGRNCNSVNNSLKTDGQLTENLVANVVLSNELPQQLLIHTSLINDLPHISAVLGSRN